MVTGHFERKTLRHWFDGSELGGHFVTSTEVSNTQFGHTGRMDAGIPIVILITRTPILLTVSVIEWHHC